MHFALIIVPSHGVIQNCFLREVWRYANYQPSGDMKKTHEPSVRDAKANIRVKSLIFIRAFTEVKSTGALLQTSVKNCNMVN